MLNIMPIYLDMCYIVVGLVLMYDEVESAHSLEKRFC